SRKERAVPAPDTALLTDPYAVSDRHRSEAQARRDLVRTSQATHVAVGIVDRGDRGPLRKTHGNEREPGAEPERGSLQVAVQAIAAAYGETELRLELLEEIFAAHVHPLRAVRWMVELHRGQELLVRRDPRLHRNAHLEGHRHGEFLVDELHRGA